ncbi:methyltransferase domain-containing protein [Staphylococcus sp. ACRSN]|uniref:class I SAM-dependent methyltransferase n=1 Tax=Staphylococcus sp. ACRSN TaxID=2918214 RepID=UPI001EF1EEF9|nr:class I SAM-dependent methyltransferase [Staphylococcus sp. ACRSN]MCG7339129.1 methyltransferase domain-containing protein [Staphylococcus sp. ACRSN]
MTKENIINYWDKRSESFSKDKVAELESNHAMKWLEEINQIKKVGPGIKVLDIGTGAGFLAILCAQQHADVHGIDLSPDMIQAAQANAQQFDQTVNFKVMDAEQLQFDDNYFDIVIARNVTWLLPNTKTAYSEWLRVLKEGGTLINIDADYGNTSFESYDDIPTDHAHHNLGHHMLHESEQIKNTISINSQRRPQYDINILKQLGIVNVHLDQSVYKRIYQEQDQFYNPTPIFLISITK